MKLTCSQCGKRWHEAPAEYRARIKKSVNGKLFCSRDCFVVARRTGAIKAKYVQRLIAGVNKP